MSKQNSPLYCPALRLKAGELAGVRDLAPDVAAYTLPRFIVPPLSERDPSQPTLFMVDRTPDISAALGRHWRGRRALIDVAYLIEEVGRRELDQWLPRMLQRVRRSGLDAIPVASLADLKGAEAPAFAASKGTDQLKLGILVTAGDLIDTEFTFLLRKALKQVELLPEACVVIADFSDGDFTSPSVVAPIIRATLEQLQEIGSWQHVIFQGTHYPEANPVAIGCHELWPRNEWAAWQEAVKFDPTTAEHMMFGDYAADSAKMNFKRSRAAAIRHYRYTTSSAWLIQRGEQSGSDMQIMRDVCRKIVSSGHFAGPSFSAADAYIYRTAHSADGPGSSTTWRQINTTHHITRAISDIGEVRGVAVAALAASSNTQTSLL